MTIKSWSYSRLEDFEKCKYLAKLKLIDRIPEPERPLPPGKTEHANTRGTRIHTAAELFVKGEAEFAPELEKFKAEFDALRAYYKHGKVSLEGEWGFDKDWNPTDWRTAWCRNKLDALVWQSEAQATVVDYKTGKKFGNELKHADQMNLYALATFLRYPTIEELTVELWYLDADDLTQIKLNRKQGMKHLPSFTKRGRSMTEATSFPPNPNIYSCRYCPYGPEYNGPCKAGAARNNQAMQKVYARKKAGGSF